MSQDKKPTKKNTTGYKPEFNPPWRMCTNCVVGADCKKALDTKGFRPLHLPPRDKVDDSIIRRIKAALEKGDVGDDRKKINRPPPSNWGQIKKDSKGNLCCLQCVFGTCDRWAKNHKFVHMYGYFETWNKTDCLRAVTAWEGMQNKEVANSSLSSTGGTFTKGTKGAAPATTTSYTTTNTTNNKITKLEHTIEELKQMVLDLKNGSGGKGPIPEGLSENAKRLMAAAPLQGTQSVKPAT